MQVCGMERGNRGKKSVTRGEVDESNGVEPDTESGRILLLAASPH